MNENDASILEELLDRDLSPQDLDRLRQIASTLERDPGLARDFAQLHQVRQRLTEADAQSAMTAAEEDGFIERAIDSIQASTSEAPASIAFPRSSARVSWAHAFLGGAVAAALTLACLAGLRWLNPSDAAPAGPETSLASDDPARWLPDAPGEQSAILANLAGFYDHRAGWIATTDSDTQIGLSETAIHGLHPTVTRLSLITPDQEQLITDIALFPGQNVTVTVPRADHAPLRYLLHLTPASEPGQPSTLTVGLYLDADLYLSTSLWIDRQTVQDVGRIHTPRGDYVLRLGLAEPPHDREVG